MKKCTKHSEQSSHFVASSPADETDSTDDPNEDIAEEEQLHFRDDLSDGFVTATRKVAASWKVLESYLMMLKERAALEEQYATGLERIARQAAVDSAMGESSLSMAMLADKQLLVMRAEQCRALAASMREDIIPNIDGLIKQQAPVQKRAAER